MADTTTLRFRLRGGIAAEWATVNPTLLEREPGVETDTNAIKIGDGIRPWNELPYSGRRIQDVIAEAGALTDTKLVPVLDRLDALETNPPGTYDDTELRTLISQGDQGVENRANWYTDDQIAGIPAYQLSIGTVAPGDTAAATLTGTPPNQVLSLTLPRGDKGEPGTAATITAGATTTNAPGSAAAVTNSGTSTAAVFDFAIPAGAKGDPGTTSWTGITDKPTTFPPDTHTHDDRYYTETEVDTALAGKASTTEAVPAGGTTGQVLSKATGADHDTAWVDGGTGTGTGSAAQALAARLLPGRYVSWLTPDAPTIDLTTTETMTAGVIVSISDATSPTGTENLTMWRRDNGMQPLEFHFDGDEFEITFTSTSSNGQYTQVWVDGHPVSEGPLHNANIGVNVSGYLHLKWTSARNRHIRIVNHGAAPRDFKVPDRSQQILPVPGVPTVGILTDSYGGSTDYAGIFETLTEWIERRLNINLVRSVQGGTGYIAGGPFNLPYNTNQRRTLLRENGLLDAVVLFGSINDPEDALDADLTAAFNSTWDAYSADHPDAPLVVFGVQPSSATVTLNANNHRRNHLMYLAAQAHPAVVAFVDMLGTAKTGVVPAAWDSTLTYGAGDLVTHLGAIFRSQATGTTTVTGHKPPTTTPHHWKRISWVFTGTGYLGAATNNGNRDHLLGGDNVHPTAKGGYAFGSLMSDALVKVLSSTAPFTYFNV